MTTPDPSVPLHDALLAALNQQTDRLATAATDAALAATAAATELRESYHFSRRLKVTLAIGLVMLLLQLVSGVVLIFFAAQNHSLAATISDCTSPQGECAQRGQQQTGVAIGQIVARSIAGFIVVSECNRHTSTDRELESCVQQRLPR